MGLFSFVTDAGSKLGGKIFDITHDEAESTQSVTLSQERIDEIRTNSITENIIESEVAVEGLSVQVKGETATLQGKVATQSCSEKLTLIAGNQFGIGAVDCQLAVSTPEPEAKMYTVKSGDTLSKIAKEFYGDSSKYTDIFTANKTVLEDPNKIYVGQSLRIPIA